ncbi:unnamed protein product [Clonostachys byssicola]|uniref:Major facilitator superfamily (MFS) profile domain-containing protein n=1 Tax=Clonostachys byssicola TaxID=160290 RepID=A0A9N9UGU7_9HYPO|nr:unnamed protein product [Clonostachys byssicola]
MAGGPKKPLNIFKHYATDAPKEIFNWRLWCAIVPFALMGAARGIDEGLINGVFTSSAFQEYLGIENKDPSELANIKGNVVAMVNVGSIGGALLAFLICDRIGRVWATRVLCILWSVGIAIFMGNKGHLGAVYAGRLIAGLGIGQTTVVAPVYIAEIAPASVRGACTCFFTGAVYIGVIIAYVANYGTSRSMPNSIGRWLLPTSVHLMFAIIIFALCFIFTYESPRYLVAAGQRDKALVNLCKIRNLPPSHEYIEREMSDIELSLAHEKEATAGVGFTGLLKELFLTPSNFYRIYIGIGGQLLSQWSGGPSITIYASNLFALVGVTGTEQSLLSTVVFGVVKFCSSMICALFLVDVIGRKRSLLIGIALQTVSMAYVAAFLTKVPRIAEAGYHSSPSEARAGTGAIAFIYISGVGWALGWNSMQYLLTAELFPLRIRALSSSLVMCTHFANAYGNSRAVPNMLLPTAQGGLGPAGTFWMFAAITILGGFWVWVTIPETAGRSLETMDRVFGLPWYRIGLFGTREAERIDSLEAIEDEKVVVSKHIEEKRDTSAASQ